MSRPWTANERAELIAAAKRGEPVVGTSRRLGRPYGGVKYQRRLMGLTTPRGEGPPAHIRERLGEEPDRVIAEVCGVSIRCVGQWRADLGIPAYLSERAWSETEIDLLGKMTDAEVARRCWRTVHAVKNKRYALGIPSATSRSLDIKTLKRIAKESCSDG